MNKRNVNINFLKRQAYNFAMENATIEQFDSMADQMFTELLIERCIVLAELARDNQLQVRRVIKTHFGIEE